MERATAAAILSLLSSGSNFLRVLDTPPREDVAAAKLEDCASSELSPFDTAGADALLPAMRPRMVLLVGGSSIGGSIESFTETFSESWEAFNIGRVDASSSSFTRETLTRGSCCFVRSVLSLPPPLLNEDEVVMELRLPD